LKNDEVIDFVT